MDWLTDWLVDWFFDTYTVQYEKKYIESQNVYCVMQALFFLSIYFLFGWFYLDTLSVCLTVWSRQIVNFRVPKKEQVWLNNRLI